MGNDFSRGIRVYLETSDYGKGMAAMSAATKKYESSIQTLTEESKKLTAEGKNSGKAWDDLQKQLKQNENQLKKSQQAEIDYRAKLKQTESVLKNLSGQSYNDLIAVQKQLQKELKATSRGTDEHKTKLQQYDRVTREVSKAQADMNSQVGENGSMMSKAANGVNKYFAMFTAGFAAVTGFTLALKGFMDQRNQLEDSKANLKALTGLGDNDIEWLAKQAKDLSTQMTESGVRIRLSSKDIVDGMTIMGSKRPELLKDRDALAAVTKEALILATAGKMEAVPAFEAVAASLNQFGLKSSDASRVINALGAGALAGSAEVNNLSDSMKNVGAVANASNMSLEQTVGALEVLAEKQLVGEEAGTKLRGALLKLKEAGVGYASGSFNFRDALTDVNKKLKDLHDPAQKDALIIKMFGAENVTAGQILLDSIPKYDSMTKAVTGTSVAYEQAKINSQTMAAKLAQAKNQFNELGMELVKNLNPAMLNATNIGTLFVKFLVKLPTLLKENATIIIALVSAFTAFLVVTNLTTIALKLMYAWDKVVELGHAIKILSLRIRIALTKEATAAEMALAEATAISNKTMKGNLWGIIASAIAVALVYLIDWIKKSTELNDAQKIQIAIMDDYKEAYKQNSEEIIKQRSELTSLVAAILNTNENEQTRSRLIDELNKKYPGFISFIDKEKVTNELLASALADVNEQYDMKLKSVALNSKAQAYENATVKAMQRQLEIQDELNKLRSEPGDHDKEIKKLEEEDSQLNKNIKTYETASSTFRANAVKNNQEIQSMNTSEYYSKQMDQYKTFLRDISKKRDEYEAGSEKWNFYNDQISQANAAFKYANLKYNEIKKLEDKAKNTNKDKPTTGYTPIAEMLAALDNELTAKKNLLKQDRIDGKKDEDKYNAELLDLEVDFLTQKRNLYKTGTKEYNDLDGQIKDIQINKQKTANDAHLKSVEDSYKSIQDATNIFENTERERLQGELEKNVKLHSGNANQLKKDKEKYNASILALEEFLAQKRLDEATTYSELIGDATFNSEADKKKAVTAAKAAVTAADKVLKTAKEKRLKAGITDETANLEEIARIRQNLGLDQEKLGYMKSLKALKAHLKEVKETETGTAEAIAAFKKQKAVEYAQIAVDITGRIANAVQGYQQIETSNLEAEKNKQLALAGDNADKRQAVEREYAQKELDLKKKQSSAFVAIQIAQAIAAGALGIANIWAVHGVDPILAGIITALEVATVAVQVGNIISQNNAIQAQTLDSSGISGSSSSSSTGARVVTQAADGRWDVIGADDGRTYRNVPYNGVARTGIVTRPTLMGERGDELVVDNPTLRNLRMNAPWVIDTIRKSRVIQRAEGNYASIGNSPAGGTASGMSNEDLYALISALMIIMKDTTELLQYLKDNGIDAFVVLSQLEKIIALRDKSLKKGSLK